MPINFIEIWNKIKKFSHKGMSLKMSPANVLIERGHWYERYFISLCQCESLFCIAFCGGLLSQLHKVLSTYSNSHIQFFQPKRISRNCNWGCNPWQCWLFAMTFHSEEAMGFMWKASNYLWILTALLLNFKTKCIFERTIQRVDWLYQSRLIESIFGHVYIRGLLNRYRQYILCSEIIIFQLLHIFFQAENLVWYDLS